MVLKPDTTSVSAPLQLHAEDVTVARRQVEGDTVRVSTVTREVEKVVDEVLTHERVDIKHIAIARQIDAIPPIRQEDGVTIIPIVDEVLVIERRLVLTEEVHIRRVQVADTRHEVITLREQDILVERAKPGETPGTVSGQTPIRPLQTKDNFND